LIIEFISPPKSSWARASFRMLPSLSLFVPSSLFLTQDIELQRPERTIDNSPSIY